MYASTRTRPAAAGRVDHGHHRTVVGRERLLAQHVLAGLERGDGQLGVGGVHGGRRRRRRRPRRPGLVVVAGADRRPAPARRRRPRGPLGIGAADRRPGCAPGQEGSWPAKRRAMEPGPRTAQRTGIGHESCGSEHAAASLRSAERGMAVNVHSTIDPNAGSGVRSTHLTATSVRKGYRARGREGFTARLRGLLSRSVRERSRMLGRSSSRRRERPMAMTTTVPPPAVHWRPPARAGRRGRAAGRLRSQRLDLAPTRASWCSGTGTGRSVRSCWTQAAEQIPGTDKRLRADVIGGTFDTKLRTSLAGGAYIPDITAHQLQLCALLPQRGQVPRPQRVRGGGRSRPTTSSGSGSSAPRRRAGSASGRWTPGRPGSTTAPTCSTRPVCRREPERGRRADPDLGASWIELGRQAAGRRATRPIAERAR